MYDVIVVGGGPAGLCAGRRAASAGSRTLLVERNSGFDAPVTCGEFLPALEEAQELVPNARELPDYYRFACSSNIANTTSSIAVYSPSNKSYEFEFHGLVLNKNLVNCSLGSAAEKAGAEIAMSCRVDNMDKEPGCIKLHAMTPKGSKTMRTRVVIGADGFPSIVASSAGLRNRFSEDDLALCLNFLMTEVETDEDRVEMYFGNKTAPGGYAWIIPKRERVANVGLGARLSKLRPDRDLQGFFDIFREKHPVASRKLLNAKAVHRSAKILPVGGLAQDVCGDGVLLAGDSAGTVIPINGGGILTAAISGRIAGEIAYWLVQGGGDITIYRKTVETEIGDVLQRGLMYRKAADHAMRFDPLFQIALSLLDDSYIGKIVQCRRSFLSKLLGLL